MEEYKRVFNFFNTPSHKYVHDAFTGRILTCDELTIRILKDYLEDNHINEEKICNRIPQESCEEISSRIRDINELINEEGMFRVGRFKFVESEHGGLSDNIIQLVLNLTDDCNLRCRYCVFSDEYPIYREYRPSRMSMDTAMKAIDLVVKAKDKPGVTISLSFFGGEPLLEADLMINIVNEAKRIYPNTNFIVGITTNGTIINQNILEFFVTHSVDLMISLDGPREVHDYHRHGKNKKGSFDAIIKTLVAIKEFDCEYFEKKVGFVCVLSPPLKFLERATFFAENPNLPKHFILRITDQVSQGLSQKYADEIENSYKEYHDEIWQIYKRKLSDPSFTKSMRKMRENQFLDCLFGPIFTRIFNRHVKIIENTNKDIMIKEIQENSCLPNWNRLYFSPEGDIFPCIPASYYRDKRMLIGNIKDGINEQSINNIIKDWKNIQQEKCSTCWAAQMCLDCYAIYPYEQANHCDLVRDHFTKALSWLAELGEIRGDLKELYGPSESLDPGALTAEEIYRQEFDFGK